MEPIEDKIYFDNLVRAIKILGRLPKSTERKQFGLNFSKRRYPTLRIFVEKAAELGVIDATLLEAGEPAETNSIDSPYITAVVDQIGLLVTLLSAVVQPS